MKTLTNSVLLVIINTLCSFACQAQFLESQSMVRSEIKTQRQEYHCLKTAKAKKTDDGKIYIYWTVQGDLNEGSFVIYKSRDFAEPVLIDVIHHYGYDSNSSAMKVPFYFAVIDSSSDNFYNMYHIIKQNKTDTLYPIEMGVVPKSAVDFKVENVGSSKKYYMRTPEKSEYYCLEF